MIRYEPLTIFHISDLVHNLRPADRAEVAAARGRVSVLSLWEDMRMAVESTAAVDAYGRVVCVYGVSQHPTQSEVGIVWLLGTNLLDAHMFQLCKVVKEVLAFWHKTFPVLTNYTDLRNERVLHWLKWLGFSFRDVIPVRGHDFIQFISSR